MIWSGWGFLVAVIAFGCCFLMEWGVEKHFGDDEFYQKHPWPLSLALTIAAVLLAIVARQMRPRRERRVLDLDSGEEFTLRADDSLFFIPLRFWPPLLAVLAIAALFR